MSAKEMFEALGFELINEKPLTYRQNDGGYITEYLFVSSFKRLVINEWEEYNNNEPQGTSVLYLNQLKAINKQVEELGWLEDVKD